jgi:hypothetical protein
MPGVDHPGNGNKFAIGNKEFPKKPQKWAKA